MIKNKLFNTLIGSQVITLVKKIRNKKKNKLRRKLSDIIDYNSPIIINYILLCCALFVLNKLTDGYINDICYLPSNLIINPFALHRLLLYTLVHGSFEHLIGNMALLALTGPSVEKKYGSGIVFGLMALNSVMIGLMQGVVIHQNVMGASSIVFMFVILSVFADTETQKIPLTAFIVASCYIGNELLGALTVDSVSQLSHIMGAITGLIFGLLYRKVKDVDKEKQEIKDELEESKQVIKKHLNNYVDTLKSITDKDDK